MPASGLKHRSISLMKVIQDHDESACRISITYLGTVVG